MGAEAISAGCFSGTAACTIRLKCHAIFTTTMSSLLTLSSQLVYCEMYERVCVYVCETACVRDPRHACLSCMVEQHKEAATVYRKSQ